MLISKNSVVEFHYVMSEAATEIESSHSGEPMTILIGHNNMLAGVESALMGKAGGDQVEVSLTPLEAYGEVQADAFQRIPIKHLQGARKWLPGMTATVQSNQGRKQVTLVKVGRFNVDCDMNHPLAGKTLSFAIEIVSVRDASSDELGHGHVHGKGGVHHD